MPYASSFFSADETKLLENAKTDPSLAT